MTKTTWIGGNPLKPKKKSQPVVVDSLEIVNDPLPAARAKIGLKYEAIFAKMKPGQAIKCKPEEAGKIGHALNTWLKRSGRPGIVKTCRRYETDDMGRVWLLEGK